MSPSPSRLSDHPRPLVVDAGALVNLLATDRPDDVLRCLGRAVLVEEATLGRLDGAALRRTPRLDAVRRLESLGLVEVGTLGEQSYGDFLDLVGAPPPDDLGDAQAAAVALATAVNGDVVVDEPKAAGLAGRRLGREPLHSLDLISSSAVARVIGAADVPGLLAAAAQDALIRVPPRFRPWAAELLRLDLHVLDAPTARWAPLLAPDLRSSRLTVNAKPPPPETGPAVRRKVKRP